LNAVDSWASQLRPNPRNMLGRSWFCWGNNPRKSRTGALVQSTDFMDFFTKPCRWFGSWFRRAWHEAHSWTQSMSSIHWGHGQQAMFDDTWGYF
jgi:hypothetical protein